MRLSPAHRQDAVSGRRISTATVLPIVLPPYVSRDRASRRSFACAIRSRTEASTASVDGAARTPSSIWMTVALAIRPALVTAHSIGDHPETQVGRFQKRILVGGAHRAAVTEEHGTPTRLGGRQGRAREQDCEAAGRSAATLSRACRPLCSKAENASGHGRPEKTRSTGSTSSDPLVHHRLKDPYVAAATASRMRRLAARTLWDRSPAKRQRSLAPVGGASGSSAGAPGSPQAFSGPRASRLRSTDDIVA